jgi:hypothetical protein
MNETHTLQDVDSMSFTELAREYYTPLAYFRWLSRLHFIKKGQLHPRFVEVEDLRILVLLSRTSRRAAS